MSRLRFSTFVPRAVHEPGGFGYCARQARGLPPLVLPRNAAGYRVDAGGGESELVTWKEIHQQRAERQREQLKQKLWTDERWRVRPAQVWVFENTSWLYGGWWCYIRTLHDTKWYGSTRKGEVREGSALALELMRLIPCGVLPLRENFGEWMRAFAAQHPKPKSKKDPRKAGILNGWTDGNDFFLTKPREGACGS